MFLKKSTRSLIVSTLYGIAALGGVIGVTYSAITGNLSGLDLILTASGTLLWSAAAGHAIYRRTIAKKQELDIEAGKADDTSAITTNQTYTYAKIGPLINPSLNMESAFCFALVDGYKLSSPSLPLVTRFSGSTLWFICALESFAVEYRTATHTKLPGQLTTSHPTLFGARASSWNILIDGKYLSAALLFAISIYTDETLNAFKVPGNICWLLANSIDLAEDIYTRYTEDRIEDTSGTKNNIT